MKTKLIIAVLLAAVAMLVFAAVAYAAVSEATINAILDDAADGTIDGNWSQAEIEAALDAVRNDPTYQMYGAYEDTLEDYLASLQAPGEEEGELAFTGGEILMLLGAGAGLAGSGAFLRRRRP